MLSELESQILRFEERMPGGASGKGDAIRHRFGMSPVRYWQIVNRLTANGDAVGEFPAVVHRLQRLAEKRAQGRAQRLPAVR